MFRENVNFDIDRRPLAVGVKSRVIVRVRNDGETHDVSFDLSDSEADSVNRQRPLADDVASQLRRDAKTQPPVIVTQCVKSNDFRRSVNVSQDEMPIKTPVRTK